MKILPSIIFSLLFALPLFSQVKYPTTNTVDSSDKYFGVVYPDQYRWLENLKTDTVAKWYKSQADLTNGFISKINGRSELLSEWNEVDKAKQIRFSGIFKLGNKIFYRKRVPGEVGKLFVKENGKEKLLFDPTTFEPEKKYIIQSVFPNLDGTKFVIALTHGGSEISTMKILNVSTGIFEKDEIFPCLPSALFLDNESFIYTSLKTGDNTAKEFLKNNTVKIHKFGDDPKLDKVYFSNEEYPELNLKPENFTGGGLSTSCPEFIFAKVDNDDGLINYFFAKRSDLRSNHIPWKKLCTSEDKLVKHMVFSDNRVYSITNKGTDSFKLISTSLHNPDWTNPDIIATGLKGLSLDYFIILKNYILITYSNGINQRLFKYDLKTKKTSEIKLPYQGTILIENHFEEENSCVVNITSWNRPYTEFKLNVTTECFTNSDYNLPNKYPQEYLDTEVQEIEVKGHDGEMIPLSIIYKKGIKKDGSNICLMEGYGSYGWSYQPAFNNYWLSLVSKGVVLAIAHVRGGGEKGDAWQKGGFKTTKPNTWKDFNSCAEYLITNGFTSAKKIIGSSGSAGGILVSRAMTERPELYGTIISNAGVLNTMRLEKMPNGQNLAFQFGTTKDSVECKALYEMDGLLHLKENTEYPAVICVTGWNDPRVSLWQSGKFIAALQNKSKKLSLLKINYDSGHFTDLADLADYWSFALWQCGHPNFTLK
jgi:prolyl oligopeptidase